MPSQVSALHRYWNTNNDNDKNNINNNNNNINISDNNNTTIYIAIVVFVIILFKKIFFSYLLVSFFPLIIKIMKILIL